MRICFIYFLFKLSKFAEVHKTQDNVYRYILLYK